MKPIYSTTLTAYCLGMIFLTGCGTASKNVSDRGSQTAPGAQTVTQPVVGAASAPAQTPVVVQATPVADETPAAAATPAAQPATTEATPVVANNDQVKGAEEFAAVDAPPYIVTVTDASGRVVDQKGVNLGFGEMNDPAMLSRALVGGQSMIEYGSGGTRVGFGMGERGCVGRWCRSVARQHYPVCVVRPAMVSGWVWADSGSWIARTNCDPARMVTRCLYTGSYAGGWYMNGRLLARDMFCNGANRMDRRDRVEPRVMPYEAGRDQLQAGADQDLTLRNGGVTVGYKPGADRPIELDDGRKANIYQRSYLEADKDLNATYRPMNKSYSPSQRYTYGKR